MESLATLPKSDIIILSKFLLSDDLPKASATNYSDIPRKEDIDCQVKLEESPVLFKNLAYEVPASKRKNSFSATKTVKKLKTKPSNHDYCGAGDDNEVKIFNYLTGTYETIKQTIKEPAEDSLDINDEITLIKDENLLANERPLDKDEFERASIVKGDLVGSVEFEVFDNTILTKPVNSWGQVNSGILEQSLPVSLINHNGPQILNRENSGNATTKSHVVVLNDEGKFDSQLIAPPLNSNLLPELQSNATKPHLEPHLERELTLGQLWEYKCKSCQYIAKTTTELMSHIQRMHLELSRNGDMNLEHSNRNKIVKTLLWRDGTKCDVVFKCSDCDTVFDDRSLLEKHVCLLGLSVLKHFRENVHSVGQKETSILHSLLTANEDNSKNGSTDMEEAIEIFSDDDKKINMLTNNECKSQRGTNEDNLVVLSDDGDVINRVKTEKEISCTLETELESDVEGVMNESEVLEVISGVDDNHMDQNSDESCDNGVEDQPSDSDDIDLYPSDQSQKFQCFDCRYSNEGNLPQFRRHVAKHIGSKFRCMPHSDASDSDCAKCRYENTLSDVKKYTKRCLKCGHVTEEAHVCDVHCSPGDVKCFHCPYVTSRKKYLYYHAVDHVQEGFACDEHVTSASLDACLKCVYEYCLEMAENDVLVCEICGFKSVIMAVFDVHQCNNACGAPYTCWDCKLDSFNTIDELRQHAVAHYKSGFRCKDHEGAVNNCSQCLYQALADSLEGTNAFVCEKCGLSEGTIAQHSCTGSNTQSDSRQFKCYHCTYKTSNKNLLKYHCKEHYGATFACEDHPPKSQQPDDCPKCVYQKLLNSIQKSLFACTKCSFKTFNAFHFKSHKSSSHSTTASDSTLPFQCFDCTAKFQFFRGLKYHAVCHSDSKFECTDHKSNHVPTCPKCIYENIINLIREDTLTCKNCGFKSYVWSNMKSHEATCEAYKSKLQSSQLKPVETYSCFDCDFSHERFGFLKAHVKDHRDSKFQCDEHKSANADCPKCRYVQIVSAAPPTALKRRLFCYDCCRRKSFVELLLLHKHVAKEHPQSNFACTLHVGKKNSSCTRCLYAKVVEDVVGHKYVKLICWGCDENKLFPCKDSYEDHIVHSHMHSEFSCPEHSGKNHKRCSKCLYQKILQRPTKTVTFQCYQCKYSHKQFSIFRRHARTCHPGVPFECDKHSNPTSEYCPQCFYCTVKTEKPGSSPLYRCYECDSQRTFRRLLFLREHVKEEHKKSSFVCALHPNEGGTNCARCWFEMVTRHLRARTGDGEYRYECTRCNYKSDKQSSFKSHKHRKFECKEHYVKDCTQCFSATNEICYACVNPTSLPNINALKEHIVEHHKASTFVCPSHTVKTVDCDKCMFQRQLERIEEQRRTSLLQCVDCDYTSAKYSVLRYHVWQHHRDSQYQCKQHLVKQQTGCQKCLYAALIESIRKFTCYGCETLPTFSGVDSLRGHVYDVHEKEFFVCPDEHCSSSRNDCGKCAFQKLVRDVFILQCHDCDVPKTFRDKEGLKQHIKEHHVNSQFTCNLHPLGAKCGTCSQCCYEELLLRPKINEFPNFKCFDCNYYETDKGSSIKSHIQKEHFDSEFTCRTHSLGEIDRSCSECTYENLVLQVKEPH